MLSYCTIMNIRFFTFLFLPLLLFSCAGNKHLTSFQDIDRSVGFIPLTDSSSTYRLRFKTDDRILIVVTSVDPNLSAMFNLPTTTFLKAGEIALTTTQTFQTYLVDTDGLIMYPMLGMLRVAGLTKQELRDLLIDKLKPYFKETPVIDIQLTNFYVYLSGEVNRPGKIFVEKESISLMEAIITAEDVTSGGRKDRIIVIRNNGSENEIYHFDLTSSESLKAQNFFLQQNDVVYVPPTEHKKRDTDESKQFLTIFLPILSTLISALSVLSVILIK